MSLFVIKTMILYEDLIFTNSPVADVIEKVMRELFEIKTEKEVRLWNKYMTNTYERLNKPDNTVQDVGLYPGQIIVIEEQNDDGTWPRHTKRFEPLH